MISITNKFNTPSTTIKKIKENLWEFTLTSTFDEQIANYENTCRNILKEK